LRKERDEETRVPVLCYYEGDYNAANSLKLL